jgi:hypothetical protein
MNGNITLYAVWETPVGATYTLSYDANGGTGAPPAQEEPINTNAAISLIKPTRPNFVFSAWRDLTTNLLYQPGGSIFMDSPKRLSADWEQGLQETRTVKGQVMPMAVQDIWGVGDSFLPMFDVVVELRPTFLTPASPQLSTKAVLMNTSGVGEFILENVPFGVYVLYIKRPGYLARPMMVTVSASSTDPIILAPPDPLEMGIFVLWPGDVNNDGKIDPEDANLVTELLGVNVFDPRYDPSCDFNADGIIDPDDLNKTIDYNNKIVTDYSGAGGVDPFK